MGPFLILFILIGCGEKRSVRPGVSSKSELIQIMGEPFRTDEVPAGEVLAYKNNDKFQITGNTVTDIFRDPSGDERNLLYWRHRFKDCETSERPVTDDPAPEIELSCSKLGQSAIFLQGSGKVIRVGEYESR